MKRHASVLLALCLPAALVSCSRQKSPYSNTGDGFFELNEGYSLLYQLMAKNQNIDTLLIVKEEEGDVYTHTAKIADASARVAKQLETFARLDSRLKLDLETLPWIEQRTREAIEATRTENLLLSTGWRFELELLLSELDGLGYASHMAAMLAESEIHEARKAYLGVCSKELGDLHQGTIDLIASRYKP
jgi:hypothetical protein